MAEARDETETAIHIDLVKNATPRTESVFCRYGSSRAHDKEPNPIQKGRSKSDSDYPTLTEVPILLPKSTTLSRTSSITSSQFSETDFFLTSLRLNRELQRIRDEGVLTDDFMVLDNINIPADLERFRLFMEMAQLRDPGMENPAKPQFPCSDEVHTNCCVCFDTRSLRRRLCCDFPVCDECMENYIAAQVKQRIVKIECPNTDCQSYVHRDEIFCRLSGEMKEKFYKFLIDANQDPLIKTCPRCSKVCKIDKVRLNNRKEKKKGIKVTCVECDLIWCFSCQAPWHGNVSCKQFRKGDKMVKNWAHEIHYGKCNAQKCPKCKVFIEKKAGCDHMTCNQCHTSFCYRCGERYFSLKIIGDHSGTYSPFGCKYNFLPEHPGARRFIRGSFLGAKVLGSVLLLGLAAAAGAAIIGASAIILPAYGGYRYHKHRQRKKWLEKRETLWKQHRLELMRAEAAVEKSKNDDKVQTSDDEGTKEDDDEETKSQQVEVWVHYGNHCFNTEPSDLSSTTSDSETSSNHGNSKGDDSDTAITTAQLSRVESPDSQYPQVTLRVETKYSRKSNRSSSDSGNLENDLSCNNLPDVSRNNWKSNMDISSNKSSDSESHAGENFSQSDNENENETPVSGTGEKNRKSSVCFNDLDKEDNSGCLVKLFGIQFNSTDNKSGGNPVFEKIINTVEKEAKSSSFFKTSKKAISPKLENVTEIHKKSVVDVKPVERCPQTRQDLPTETLIDQPDIVTCALESKRKKRTCLVGTSQGEGSQLGSHANYLGRDVPAELVRDPYLGVVSPESCETAL
ncbi:hypothetical protein ScPMuIL_007998 [Solemya velum]